jgi:hypothetical protein
MSSISQRPAVIRSFPGTRSGPQNLIAYQRARSHGGYWVFARFERLLAERRFRGVDHRTVTADKDRRKFPKPKMYYCAMKHDWLQCDAHHNRE